MGKMLKNLRFKIACRQVYLAICLFIFMPAGGIYIFDPILRSLNLIGVSGGNSWMLGALIGLGMGILFYIIINNMLCVAGNRAHRMYSVYIDKNREESHSEEEKLQPV